MAVESEVGATGLRRQLSICCYFRSEIVFCQVVVECIKFLCTFENYITDDGQQNLAESEGNWRGQRGEKGGGWKKSRR